MYYAKSVLSDGSQPTVAEHLSAVSKMAEGFGENIGLGAEASLAGKLHDFGKYSQAFKKVLDKKDSGIDHAFCGAAFLLGNTNKKTKYSSVIEAINGHHSGLTELSLMRGKLLESLKNDNHIEANDRKTSALAGIDEYRTAYAAFKNDFPDFKLPAFTKFQTSSDTDTYIYNLETMLHTRMVFSCLVDADYTVSASDNNKSYVEESEISDFEPREVLKSLYRYRQKIKDSSTADSELNNIRDLVFDQCGKTGEGEHGLYTLTAPTGTGKTLALMHFALKNCIKYGKKRIIVVLPFLALTNQSMKAYREIYPDMLEDSSQSELSDAEREYSARWSTPVIVTTSVKFFEALFSRKPTDCRKLHNIADSVVIFDEAQSLPKEVTASTLLAVKELCRSYSCTVLFSTATQPDFSAIPDLYSKWNPTEILPVGQSVYDKLRRTEVEWCLRDRTPLEAIAEEMSQYDSVCTIVNLRKHAVKLYKALKSLCGEDEVFMISSDLCAKHREENINTVKARLADGLPCRVVSTQCIEAGVDLDFNRMYRALAPLEAVIQAAGRCNRNGKYEKGHVTVFVPDEGRLYPDDHYANAAEILSNMCSTKAVDIDSLEDIKDYYGRLFQNADDNKMLKNAIENNSFEETDKNYKLIDNRGEVRIIVPYKGCMELFNTISREIKENGITPKLMKMASGITVTRYASKNGDDELTSYAEQIRYAPKHYHSDKQKLSDFYILRSQHFDKYTDDMGLQIEEEEKNISQIY